MPAVSRTPGHVFVLHGLIENFSYDAVVVPTDDDFVVENVWKRSVTGDLSTAKPGDWPRRHFARSRNGDAVWFVSVSGVRRIGPSALVGRVREVLREIAGATARHRGEPLPRIAIPVIGIGRGGLGSQRGALLGELLRTLHEFASEGHADILLVTPDAAVFAAAQHVRRAGLGGNSLPWRLSPGEMEKARRLGKMAADGHLALFLGAGVSIAAGLPSWNGLLERLGAEAGERPEDFGRLGSLDQAQYLAAKLGVDELNERVKAVIGTPKKVALAHSLMAGLKLREAVTTNYDDLFERAIEAAGSRRPSILPWDSVSEERGWLLKLHGDAARPGSIVLTRRDFVLFDAKSRPAGSLLQALLLTKHVLIVGTSLADDNVIRLAMEVDEYLRKSGDHPVRGTFLDVSGVAARKELWTNQFDWLLCEGSTTAARIRQMEILLDAVAAFAADDASWLLDERFAGLLSVDDQAIADQAGRLLELARNQGSPLVEPLVAALSSLGRPVERNR
ncbi:hypothetical protein GR168_03815 [Gordonia sp. JH63]|nr:hypothetical protein GR168_03815 [Gordonia sp. JH63]